MFLVLEKESHRILRFGNRLDYLDNGYPRLIEENVAFPTERVDIVEIESIPEYIKSEKYCYTEDSGFYLNEDWLEPDEDNVFGVPVSIYHQIIDSYTMKLIEEGTIV